jgi:nucleotide-binding universal stress UspA family protein
MIGGKVGQGGERTMSLTVLVPLDGSPLAARALPFATQLASAGGGSVVLVHVQTSLSSVAPLDYDLARDVEALRRAGLNVTSLVYCAPTEDTADMLGLAVREARPDLVVMSTHGRGGLRRSVFGSVADTLIRRVEVPVVLVTPHCDASWAARPPAQILVPLDGSPLAEQALHHAARLARLVDAEILLVRSVSSSLHPRYRNDKLVLSCADFVEIEDAWRYLSNVADGLRSARCRVSIRVLVGSTAVAVAHAARTEGMDLIVMTTHGRGGLSRYVIGSVADGVLQRANVPILLVRSGVPPHGVLATSSSTGPDSTAQRDAAATSEARSLITSNIPPVQRLGGPS